MSQNGSEERGKTRIYLGDNYCRYNAQWKRKSKGEVRRSSQATSKLVLSSANPSMQAIPLNGTLSTRSVAHNGNFVALHIFGINKSLFDKKEAGYSCAEWRIREMTRELGNSERCGVPCGGEEQGT